MGFDRGQKPFNVASETWPDSICSSIMLLQRPYCVDLGKKMETSSVPALSAQYWLAKFVCVYAFLIVTAAQSLRPLSLGLPHYWSCPRSEPLSQRGARCSPAPPVYQTNCLRRDCAVSLTTACCYGAVHFTLDYRHHFFNLEQGQAFQITHCRFR